MSLSRFPWLGSNVRTAESFPGVIPNQIWEMKLGGFSLSSIGFFLMDMATTVSLVKIMAMLGFAWQAKCVCVRVLFRFLIDI